jgi:hypothetical protein
MASAPNTTNRKPCSLNSSNPEERFQAQRMEGDCKGHSPATRAAMAFLVTSNMPRIRLDMLAVWPDHQLWQAAKKAHKINPQTLQTLSDQLLQSIAWGEAVALLWGLTKQTPALPTGSDVYAIINAASPGFGDAIKGLVYDVDGIDLPPFSDLKWKFQNFMEDPFKPSFKNWMCLPWWPDQCMDVAAAVKESLALLDEPTA